MKNIDIHIHLNLCNLEELSDLNRTLIEAAINATKNAYAKYSHFCVGAAVLLDDGSIVIGANQENAAYPSGLCAERVAVFAAQSQFPEKSVKAIAIAAKNDQGLLDFPITPCGSCRQVLLEIENRYSKDIKVFLYGNSGVFCIKRISDLLPLSFSENNM